MQGPLAPGAGASGRDNVLAFLGVFHEAFPDLRLEIKQLLGDGSAAAAEGSLVGTHDGVLHTPNVRATYEELKSKGVFFKSEPKEQFYGIECIVTDGCGNWFSLTEPKN